MEKSKIKKTASSDAQNSKILETGQSNSNIERELPQRRKFLVTAGIVVIVILFVLSPFFIANSIFKRAGVGNYMEVVKSFILPGSSPINSQNNKVNILVLGIGGKGHDGSDLTDTIILASVSLTNNSIELISIPRDIWIPEIRAKINSAYYWGNLQSERGGGLNFSKEIVSKVTGQVVNYALVIDFSGFQDIIDTIGGIDVIVDQSFTDTKYPIAGRESDTCNGDTTFACRYQAIHFEKGLAHMDGVTALTFVRSREGDNGENTDFARSARQQKVISAVGKKVISARTILNPFKDYRILIAIKNSIETDLDPTAAGILARTVLASKNSLNSSVLSTDLLINPPISPTYDKQYVLIPKMGNGKWEEINNWVASVLK